MKVKLTDQLSLLNAASTPTNQANTVASASPIGPDPADPRYRYGEHLLARYDLEAQLVSLEQEIPNSNGNKRQKLAAHLQAVKIRLEASRSYLIAYGITPPILHLPADVMYMIFKLLLLPKQHSAERPFNRSQVVMGRHGARRLPRRYDQRQTLQLVCMSWNKLLVNSAVFWTTLHLPFPISSFLDATSVTEVYTKLADRCGKRPLRLVLNVYETLDKSGSLADNAYNLPGWYGGNKLIHIQPLMRYLYKRAHELVLYERCPTLSCIGGLKQLWFENVSFSGGFSSSTSVARPPLSCMNVLLETPLLEMLGFDYSDPFAIEDQIAVLGPRLRLRNLRWLRFNSQRALTDPTSFLSSVSLPKLTSIQFSYPCPVLEQDPIAVKLNSVRQFSIRPQFEDVAHLISIIKAFPHVRELSIDGEIRRGAVASLNIDPLLQALGTQDSSGSPVLAAMLSHLSLKHCRVSVGPFMNWVDFWSRADGNIELTDCAIFPDVEHVGNGGRGALVQRLQERGVELSS